MIVPQGLFLSLGWQRLFPCGEVPEQLYGVSPQCPRNRDKFDDIDTTLAALILGYERLMFVQPVSQLLLAHPGSIPRRDKDRDQPGVFRGFEGLIHMPPEP